MSDGREITTAQGAAALSLAVSLTRRLIRRGRLTADEAREMIDGALLGIASIEGRQGRHDSLTAVRRDLEEMLRDLPLMPPT